MRAIRRRTAARSIIDTPSSPGSCFGVFSAGGGWQRSFVPRAAKSAPLHSDEWRPPLRRRTSDDERLVILLWSVGDEGVDGLRDRVADFACGGVRVTGQ